MKTKIQKIMLYVTFAITLFLVNFRVAFAEDAANYGEKGTKYFLGQMAWVDLGVTGFVIVIGASKKSISTIIIAIIVGGLGYYFLKNPTAIGDIGTKLAGVFGM